MAEYKLTNLERAFDHFEDNAGFGEFLKNMMGKKLVREKTYDAFLKATEKHFEGLEIFRGMDAHQVAIDSLVISNGLPDILTIPDYMISESVRNYARLLKDKPEPTGADKDAAAESCTQELSTMLYDLVQKNFIKSEYLTRHWDMYAGRFHDCQEAQTQDRRPSLKAEKSGKAAL